ncbi:MAG: M4 family metallopeptidase [Nocardioidaceae bacterium]
MQYRTVLAISAAAVLAASTTVLTATTSSAASPSAVTASQSSQPSGSFAFSGPAAAHFKMPEGMREVHTSTFPGGRTQTRYQQMVDGASVLGAQITVIRSASGEAETVIGAHFPSLQAKNKVKLSKQEAKQEAVSEIGAEGDFDNTLRLDPRTGRLFYEVQSIRADERPVLWIDATSGETVKEYDGLTEGEGIGVKGDTKTIDTSLNAAGDLYRLASGDLRQVTYDAFNSDGKNKPFQPKVMTDADDIWDLAGNTSPAQPAGVDAHYYAGVVDDFYGETFGRNSIDDQGMRITSVVHFAENYCNAFWNGAYMTYGDGNGTTCKSLSGGLDVDGHELTHGVTDFTSNLIYEDESGALNEAFSDMMGNTIEFYADEHGLDPAAEPDWLIGEDVINRPTDATPGFRNMGDPMQDGDPSHVSQQYFGEEDNGGVHSNSGIANHAYYLTVNGGSNASCTANQYHNVLLRGKDCNIVVPALGLDKTAQIYYEGFTSLPEYGNFCDARNATIAAAGGSRNGKQTPDAKAVGMAWDAVGVHSGCKQGTPPPPPCVGSANATLPIESPHPYGNNGDCTWTYDNGSAGFKFHFTLMDMELDYDYVYVKDANGNLLNTYTGTIAGGFDSACIPTSTGSVQMVTDPAVTGQGFTIDSVTPC